MAETIGSIQVVATINTKDYDSAKKHIESGNKDLEKQSNSSADTISSKWGGAFKAVGTAAAVGLAAAGAATVALVTSSVKSFAEYEQLVGGVETLFKSSSDTVMQYANDAYKNAGLSANQYMNTITGFSASLLQGLGGDTAKAAQIGNQAVTDMSDNANKFGTSMESIQFAYQGFAKDNFTMLDNLKLGYGGTAEEMARLVNNSGVMGKNFKATAENVKNIPFDKLIEAIHVTQNELDITGTTAKEASTTISGSFATMQSAWQNLITGMADPKANFSELLKNFIDSAKTFGKNVVPAISQALTGVVDLIAALAPELIRELPKLLQTLLPKIIDTAISIMVLLVQTLVSMLPILILGLVQLINGLVQAIVTVLPLLASGFILLITSLAKQLPGIFNILIAAILVAMPIVIKALTDPTLIQQVIVAGLQLFMAIIQAIPQVVTALIGVLPYIIAAMTTYLTDPTIIKQVIKAAVILFMGLVFAVPQILGALFNAFALLLNLLWQRLQNNFSRFGSEFGGSIGEAIKSGINGVLRWINNQVNSIIDTVNKGMKSIDDILPGDQSGMRISRINIPMLAQGGVVSSPTLAMIGEGSQPEAVLPLSVLDSMLNGDTKKSGDTYQITVNASADMIRSENDKREFAKMIVDSFNQTRKAKGLPAIG